MCQLDQQMSKSAHVPHKGFYMSPSIQRHCLLSPGQTGMGGRKGGLNNPFFLKHYISVFKILNVQALQYFAVRIQPNPHLLKMFQSKILALEGHGRGRGGGDLDECIYKLNF